MAKRRYSQKPQATRLGSRGNMPDARYIAQRKRRRLKMSGKRAPVADKSIGKQSRLSFLDEEGLPQEKSHLLRRNSDRTQEQTCKPDEELSDNIEPSEDESTETIEEFENTGRAQPRKRQRSVESASVRKEPKGGTESGIPDDEISVEATDADALAAKRRKRTRKQAEAYRAAEAEADSIIESLEDVTGKENSRYEEISDTQRKIRLNHGDEGSGMIHGAGRIARAGLNLAAAPAKQYMRARLSEADQDNTAIQSAEAAAASGKRLEKLLESSRRKQNLDSANLFNRQTNANSHEKAAQTERRKKDQIRAFQKKKRQRAAAAAKRSESVVSAGGFVDSARSAFTVPAKAKKAAQTFFSQHKGAIIGVAVVAVLFSLLAVSLSSCAALVQGGGTTIIETTYASTDQDIYAAENAYCALESSLDVQVNAFEQAHPGYDEYNYQIDEIEHNPYHLISYLQVRYGAFVFNEEIKAEVGRLFAQQYQLSVSETSEMRTRKEIVTETRTVIDPATGEPVQEEYSYEQEVEYEYRVMYVVLTNKGLDVASRGNLTAEQTILYDALNRTYGNRPNLFDLSTLGSGGTPGINYTIPPEALSDEKFANLIREAEKYLGYPYVWGGKKPSTSFDCSGFVCWSINHCANNWNVGTIRAKELCAMCIYVSPSEARPGDLIFFEKTYNTTGASHVGIYVGDGVMLHCGNPIKYSSINTRYFKEHFLCFGRLPFYDD